MFFGQILCSACYSVEILTILKQKVHKILAFCMYKTINFLNNFDDVFKLEGWKMINIFAPFFLFKMIYSEMGTLE